MSHKTTAASLAAAAAALALSPAALSADQSINGKSINAGEKVSCYGLTYCSPRCGTAKFHCSSENDCKAPWMTTAKECLEKGGTIGREPDQAAPPAK